MRTLQEKYNGINEGKFTKDQFLRDARMEQPNLVTKFNGYDDAVKILKNRGMIQETYSTEESFKDYSDDALTDMIINSSRFEGNEESIARVKQELARRKKANLNEARLTKNSLTDYRYKPTNDMDKYPYEQILRGLRVELEGLNILGTPTPEEYKKALGKVLKNLEKDTIFYTNQVAGVSKKVDLHDKMVDVKKDNAVDKFNGLKKAQLKEAIKGVIKNILSENSDPDLYDQDEERQERANDYGDYGPVSDFGDYYPEPDEDVYKMYKEDEIDYDDENFSDPLIDGDEADLYKEEKSEKDLRAEWEKYQATCHPEDKMSYMEWRSEQGLDEGYDEDKIAKYEQYTYTLDGKVVEPEIAFFNNYIGAELDGQVYRVGIPDETGTVELRSYKGKTGMYTEDIFESVSLKDLL